MRIIAGTLKGRRLDAPTWDGLRPTSDKLRETLFNVLAGPAAAGARVLDVFAGTGAVGLEALSRGAAHVTFVERDPARVPLIAAEPGRCGADGRLYNAAVWRDGYLSAGTAADVLRRLGPFDLVFLDPPYDEPDDRRRGRRGESAARRGRHLVLEHASRRAHPMATPGRRLTRRSGDRATARWRSTARRRTRPDGEPDQRRSAALAIYPGLVRSADQRARGHHPPRRAAVRSHRRRGAGQRGKAPLFTPAERVEIMREVVRGRANVEVDTFDGLLVDYAQRQAAAVIVRGLRAVSDFEYEMQMALMNRHLSPDIETVFMMPAEAYTYLSSRLVKEVFALGGDVRGLVPPAVERRLQQTRGATGGGPRANR